MRLSDYERLVRRVQLDPQPGDVLVRYSIPSKRGLWRGARRAQTEELVIVTGVRRLPEGTWGLLGGKEIDALVVLETKPWKSVVASKYFGGAVPWLSWYDVPRRAKRVYGQDFYDRDLIERLVARGRRQEEQLEAMREYLRERKDEYLRERKERLGW